MRETARDIWSVVTKFDEGCFSPVVILAVLAGYGFNIGSVREKVRRGRLAEEKLSEISFSIRADLFELRERDKIDRLEHLKKLARGKKNEHWKLLVRNWIFLVPNN